MFLSKEDTLKGLECCSEFLCGECPYRIFEDKTGQYTIRCMYKLMNDLFEILKAEGYYNGPR